MASDASVSSPVTLTQRLELSALWTLFGLTLRQHCRARRLMVLIVLFLLPTFFAILARSLARNPPPNFLDHIELALIFYFIPQGLVPLTALLYASGMIQDELEEQTLTYLFIRPMPRWAIYVVKLLATLLVTFVLAGIFIAVTYLAIYWGTPELTAKILSTHLPRTVALTGLALVGYCSLFGWFSLMTRRSFVLGVAYIILFEGVIANIDFIIRRFTVLYYNRVLIVRWLEIGEHEWSLRPIDIHPDAFSAVMTLLTAGLVFAGVAATTFAAREFRVKTPEGS